MIQRMVAPLCSVLDRQLRGNHKAPANKIDTMPAAFKVRVGWVADGKRWMGHSVRTAHPSNAFSHA